MLFCYDLVCVQLGEKEPGVGLYASIYSHHLILTRMFCCVLQDKRAAVFDEPVQLRNLDALQKALHGKYL